MPPDSPHIAQSGPQPLTPITAWSFLSTHVDTLLKLLAASGVVLYAIGLLISNIYLAQYGFTDFSQLRAQCLLTGLWSALLLVVLTAPTFVSILIYPYIRAASPVARLSIAAVLFLLLTLAARAALHAFTAFQLTPPQLSTTVPWLRLAIWLNLFPLFTFCLTKKPRRPRHLLPGLACSCLFSLFLFAKFVYPDVNPAFGGGRPGSGILYLTADAEDLASHLRRDTAPAHDSDPAGGLAVELLASNSDHYLIRLNTCTINATGKREPAPRILMVSRSSVRAFLSTNLPVYPYGQPCTPDGQLQQVVQ